MYADVSPLLTRAALGAVLAAIVAGVARAVGALTRTGMLAAIVVGACAATAGWWWAAVLTFFFVASTALSRAGGATKARRAARRIDKPGARDAAQVLANGGVFAAGAVFTALAPNAITAAASIGALAAATADTWATEVGMLVNTPPRSILTWQPVPAGTSGGVTAAGTLAGVAGACVIAAGALTIRPEFAFVATIALGGISGMIADSVFGASIQTRRRCDRCNEPTERLTHACGAPTRQVGGWRWMGNDAVNVLATFTGGVVAGALAGWLWPAP
jgi:uncharacterized protein (TIGR00297 family)